MPCNDEKILKHCKKYKITKGEIALEYIEFITKLCENIKSFEFEAFDYGEKVIERILALDL